MGRKTTIMEANKLVENKKTFVYQLTSKIDERAKRLVGVTADNQDKADEYMAETYPLFIAQLTTFVGGAPII